ncbi:efflux RND transporter permease subunit [Marinobacter sp. BGYM27]|uniref:efflux RND transporter permease subunit n=1 Tax=Marinobacter sp. BGYM27 TaxID=2975597 RepID=UPI0021A2E259|nr:efflux RND transporter permease subunit [Marinobacter sp. BGYM27]MDG5499699.1 efflux RND transporter permease subunit [Marinobacter sp. BGYM27]
MTDNASQHREDILGRFARHKVAANLLMLIMILAGIYALGGLNRQFFPTFATDFITVSVVWPGASAEDVARSITTPLEQELRNLDNVKEMRSTSARGYSRIVIEYEENTPMGIALDQVNEQVGLVRNLPSDSERPEISKFVRNETIATVILTGPARLEALRPMAYAFETQLLDRGIAKVEMTGLPDREIAIEVDSESISALQMSLPQLGQRVVGQSQDIPAGSVGDKESVREIRSLEKGRTAADFANMPIIATADGRRLALGDIADIEMRPKEDSVEVFYQGQPALLMELQRAETSDSLDSADVMLEWLDDTRATLPEGIQLITFDEQYELIVDRINLLLKNGIGGLILVVGILFIFLNGRIAFWVAAGIPISLMGTMAILWFNGGSINMISLFALIMALGIIVDDAIVVAEDAMTHYQRGERSLEAAEGGARRMFVPVMSSSLTTIAAFLPLMLVSGIMGQVLRDIPFVIICVIIASLIESFLILPGHLRSSFRSNHHRPDGKLRQRLNNGFNSFRDNRFRPVAVWSLNNRATVLVATACALVISVAVVATGHVRFTFFPTPESTQVVASVKFASGTPPADVKAYGRRMEAALWRINDELKDEDDLVRAAVLRLNQASFDGGERLEQGEQYAMVSLELTPPDARSVRTPDFIKAWRKALPDLAGIEQLSLTSPQGGPPGKPIDVFLSGADADTLKKAAESLKLSLGKYQGVTDILDDLPWGKQQYIFSLTPLAQSLGLTIDDVGRQMRAALDGQLLQVFYDAHDEVEVRIMLPKAERELQQTLNTLPIATPAGSTTPLANVINLESRRGLALLRHSDGQLGVHVTADVDTDVTNANQVLTDIEQTIIPNLQSQYGIITHFKGTAEDQRQTSSDMKAGSLLGLALIYIILAWVFGSYTWPVAVMIAIPFGLCGAILGHFLLGIDLTILSLFGMFGLSGIVINDSIILVTFYKELREGGMPISEALIEASCQRLRAVLLTSLTTISGLLPLLFETSLQAQFLIPMAVSIAFGLAVGTFLILLVVPVLLSLIESATARLQRIGGAPQPE